MRQYRRSLLKRSPRVPDAGPFSNASERSGEREADLKARALLANGQRHSRNLKCLIEAGDLAARLPHSTELSSRARRVVAPIAVRVRGTETVASDDWARGELERPTIAQLRRRIRWIPEHLDHLSVSRRDDNGVSLIRHPPDVAREVERDSIDAFEQRMRHQNVLQAERVRRERRVASDSRGDGAVGMDPNTPDRSPRRVGDEQVSTEIEGEAIGDQRL